MTDLLTPAQMQSFANCLRRIEVEYGRAGWHGDVEVMPALDVVHRERNRLRTFDLLVTGSVWDKGTPWAVREGLADART